MISNVVRGVPSTLMTVFLNRNVPMEFEKGITPSWTILDPDYNIVLSGNGTQNINHPEEWLAFFTIPSEAPVDIDRKWIIQWSATVNNQQLKNTEYFTVLTDSEPVAEDTGSIMLVSDIFRATLHTALNPTNLRIQIINDADQVLYSNNEATNFKVTRNGGLYRVDFDSKTRVSRLNTTAMGMYPYIVQWSYDTETGTNTEFQMLYVVNAKAIWYIDNMKRYLDKARNYDINPNLRWTDAELAHFLMMGMQRINVSPPTLTSWSVNTLPISLNYALEKCAEHEALNALYLAEGYSAFNFNGASTTLEVDRTQYIQTKMDEINSWLSENLRDIKRNVIRSSGAGVLSISVTPSTNNVVRLSNSFILSRLIRWGSYLM